MKRDKLKEIDFYFITDRGFSKENFFNHIEDALKAGVKIIQYRDPTASKKEKVHTALRIMEFIEDKAIFIINNDVDVALAVDADGVHLGQDDMPYEIARKLLGNDKIIGITTHNLKEAKQAEDIGADYIALSPIFETKTKLDAGKPSGLKFIEEAKKNIKIPFVAIGGMTQDNLKDVLKAGAKSVVMISAVLKKDDVYKEIKKIRNVISKPI